MLPNEPGRTGTRRCARGQRKFDEGGVGGERRRPHLPEPLRGLAVARLRGHDAVDESAPVTHGHVEAVRVARPAHTRRVRSVQRQRLDPFGIGRCEQDAHRPAFGRARQVGALDAGRVHHGTDVVHPLFEREVGRTVGSTDPALVVPRHPCVLSDLLDHRTPYLVHGDGRGRGEEHVVPFAERPVRDVKIATAGVLDRRHLHTRDPTHHL